MDITPILAEDAQRITAYGSGLIRVNEQDYTMPVLVQMTRAEIWQHAGLDEPALLALTEMLEPVEILLIGTGAQGVFLPPALRRILKERSGAGVEVMDSGAACRTYNVLLAEGRQVAAALLLP